MVAVTEYSCVLPNYPKYLCLQRRRRRRCAVTDRKDKIQRGYRGKWRGRLDGPPESRATGTETSRSPRPHGDHISRPEQLNHPPRCQAHSSVDVHAHRGHPRSPPLPSHVDRCVPTQASTEGTGAAVDWGLLPSQGTESDEKPSLWLFLKHHKSYFLSSLQISWETLDIPYFTGLL